MIGSETHGEKKTNHKKKKVKVKSYVFLDKVLFYLFIILLKILM